MVDVVSYPIVAASLVFAAWALVMLVADRNPREWFVIGAGVIEVLLLVQAIVAVIIMIAGDGPADMALFISYLIFTLLLMPATLLWALVEKSRWGTGVLVFAALVVAALVVRLQDIWEGVPSVV
ncbi:hypothetical protein EF847_00770 [Actinobacteria bacterium YIM 96077]|uniref:Integral membrane protein n=1 Tax=Phytoactinopolyspora halophila TaxID=1981511 RepID=A0A329R1H4_9ACTN|nr:hypothetical protein [Phytoactinopolyspora halophila]AYY11471.1 hypothetical protein EF847_00770 [Actinobacteria bacterium YIM 96077]RAW18046.1 hypothetical protein DPM12_04235 [Phytoactinopolyspora halophila]